MKKTVLVVDDDQSILDALDITLSDAGYEVITNSKGEKTVDLVHKHLPDIILLDILISGADGRDIAKILKQNPFVKHIPIIMLSAHPTANKTIHATGADAFLPKPFDIDELLKIVEKYTNKGKGESVKGKEPKEQSA